MNTKLIVDLTKAARRFVAASPIHNQRTAPDKHREQAEALEDLLVLVNRTESVLREDGAPGPAGHAR